MSTPVVPACPDCGGPWLDGWRWAHVPLRCLLRAADDATQAADSDRATDTRPPFTRPATATEAVLWGAATDTALPTGAETTVHAAGGYWAREVGGHLNAADALAATTPITTPEGEAA
ncbi:hypothetical protein CIK52_01625 [Kocuria rosea]|nr:hypothetical protein CIK52_01625 [Kocuria rosea]TQN34685.1 hypothetical protein FHX38_2789 [Kocuria rosea]